MDSFWKFFTFLALLELSVMLYIYVSTSEKPLTILDEGQHRDTRDKRTIYEPRGSNNYNNRNIKENAGTIGRHGGSSFDLVESVPIKAKSALYSLSGKFDSERRKHSGIINGNSSKPSLYNLNQSNIRSNKQDRIEIKNQSKHRLMKRNGEPHFYEKTRIRSAEDDYSQSLHTNGNVTTFCTLSFDKKSLEKAKRFIFNSQTHSAYFFQIHLDLVHDINLSVEEKDRLLHWQYVQKSEMSLLQLPVDIDLITFQINLFLNGEVKFVNLKTFYNDTNCIENQTKAIESVKLFLWKELFSNDTNYYLCHRNYSNRVWKEMLYYVTTIWTGYDWTCSEAPADDVNHNFSVLKDQSYVELISFLVALQFVWIFVLPDVNKKSDGNVTFSYKRGDRPYGGKRILLKFFYSDWSICLKWQCCKTFFCSSAARRLTVYLSLIILYLSFYRTFGRKNLEFITGDDYFDIIRTSEPLFHSVSNSTSAITLDSIYGCLLPCLFIWLGSWYYNAYTVRNPEHQLLVNHEAPRISDKFVSKCKYFRRFGKVSWKNCICKLFIFVFLLIYCIFPFFSFTALAWEEIIFKRSFLNNLICNGCIKVILFILCYFTSYIFCLRPLISTFTFITRAITYFVFVIIPVRVIVNSYFLIFASGIFYVLKYLHEIVNMNSEILNTIFTIMQTRQMQTANTSNSQNAGNTTDNTTGVETSEIETLEEETFDIIYRKLTFVTRRLYFFAFKSLIVLGYLFVTILTFLQNKNDFNVATFTQFLQLMLLIFGPYAVSFFLAEKDKIYLSEEDKREIESAYDRRFEVEGEDS